MRYKGVPRQISTSFREGSRGRTEVARRGRQRTIRIETLALSSSTAFRSPSFSFPSCSNLSSNHLPAPSSALSTSSTVTLFSPTPSPSCGGCCWPGRARREKVEGGGEEGGKHEAMRVLKEREERERWTSSCCEREREETARCEGGGGVGSEDWGAG